MQTVKRLQPHESRWSSIMPFSRFFHRSTGKSVLLVTSLLVALTLTTLVAVRIQLSSEIYSEFLTRARMAMRTLALTWSLEQKDLKLTVEGQLVRSAIIESVPTFANHEVVDNTATMIDGVATIFAKRNQGYERVSTTIKDETGKRALGTLLAPDHPARPSIERGERFYGEAVLFGHDYITGYYPLKNASGQVTGVLFIGLPIEQAKLMVDRLTWSVGAVAMIVLAALCFIGFFVVRRAVRPLSQLTDAAAAVGSGNLEAHIPCERRKDEIGDIARALIVFRQNASERRRLEDEQRKAEEKAIADRRAAMHKLADTFEQAVGNIIESVSSASTQLEAAANTLTNTAEKNQQFSNVVASASEEASANVQSVAAATEEMTGSIDEISRQVQGSSTIASEAVTQAQNTDARIAELSQAANRIGDVVKLITAIAEQTNLLALNATIEAARAGEAGRGFAVVAQEVKALAAQTTRATGEIGAQIASMQAATTDSVSAIKEIGVTIGRIYNIASTIAAAVEEQGAATQEIARNVQEASRGTAQVATNIVSVNRGAGETGSASAKVLTSAQSLAAESKHLKTEVEKFLQTVRAA
jgi:methyl-accepting chemotaxis protein